MFSVPYRESVTKELFQRGIRNKAPPSNGDNLCAFQLSFLPAKFESLKDETFVFIMAVQNDDRAKSRRNVAGNDVLQVIGQNAAANIDGAGETGTSSALRQRTSAIRNCRRHDYVESLPEHGGNADWDLYVDGQGQVRTVLLHCADRQRQYRAFCLRTNVLTAEFFEAVHEASYTKVQGNKSYHLHFAGQAFLPVLPGAN